MTSGSTATGYIKRQAAGNKPFFAYITLSHMHPPEAVRPDFDQTSPARLGQYAEYPNIKTGEEFNGY